MRHAQGVAITLSIILLGAGCGSETGTSPTIAEPIERSSLFRPITQHLGFGVLPKTPAPALRPGRSGSVRVTAEVPTLPAAITVLRIPSGRPSAPQLRNIASSFGIPGGTVRANPESRAFELEWKDETGVRWKYHGSTREMEFVDESATIKTLTVSAWPDKSRIMAVVDSFLEERGVNRKRYSDPYIAPDWVAWWNTERAIGHCMTAAALADVRAISASLSLLLKDPPNLSSFRSACMEPEFPSRIVIRMSATQDGQGIFLGEGTPVYGATLYFDATTHQIVAGSFLLSSDPERSDYPALTIDEARARLAQGGQGGTPNGDVTITKIFFEWFRVEIYLYPAFVGVGTITYRDGTTSPYRIVVPLLRD